MTDCRFRFLNTWDTGIINKIIYLTHKIERYQKKKSSNERVSNVAYRFKDILLEIKIWLTTLKLIN